MENVRRLMALLAVGSCLILICIKADTSSINTSNTGSTRWDCVDNTLEDGIRSVTIMRTGLYGNQTYKTYYGDQVARALERCTTICECMYIINGYPVSLTDLIENIPSNP